MDETPRMSAQTTRSSQTRCMTVSLSLATWRERSIGTWWLITPNSIRSAKREISSAWTETTRSVSLAGDGGKYSRVKWATKGRISSQWRELSCRRRENWRSRQRWREGFPLNCLRTNRTATKKDLSKEEEWRRHRVRMGSSARAERASQRRDRRRREMAGMVEASQRRGRDERSVQTTLE